MPRDMKPEFEVKPCGEQYGGKGGRCTFPPCTCGALLGHQHHECAECGWKWRIRGGSRDNDATTTDQ